MRNAMFARAVAIAPALVLTLAVSAVSAHSPVLDLNVDDWCLDAAPYTYAAGGRVENGAATLVCGRCSGGQRACLGDAECPSGQICVELASKVETVWWDDRADAAVNDLATIATTQDDSMLYFALQVWVTPDPLMVPIFEIGIDFEPGGIGSWYDPAGRLTDPGHCSASSDRACATDADCHFCTISLENPPSTRPRTCGSGCDPNVPGDLCDSSQMCVGVGTLGAVSSAGVNAIPASLPDVLLIIDLGRWLVGVDTQIQLMKAVGGSWSPLGTFQIPSGIGIGGESIPAASIELGIPWSAFGCTGCPGACSCPDFGPGQAFGFSATVARDAIDLDFAPFGAIEDVISEAVGGVSTTTADSCPGSGTSTTLCEIADGSQDAFVDARWPLPGGQVDGLVVTREGGPFVRLDWSPSCSPIDVDYQVYEGALGSVATQDPTPALCTTGGATSVSISAPMGDVYFLIVPSDGSTEGSYGLDGTGSERPASTAACRAQSLGACPD